jgi:hypothetical protein
VVKQVSFISDTLRLWDGNICSASQWDEFSGCKSHFLNLYISRRNNSSLMRGINLCIGCSDAGMFSLTRDRSVRLLRISGATAKGLGQGNANSQRILKFVERQLNGSAPIKSIIWIFGTVDVKFSAYYELCEKRKSSSKAINLRDLMINCAVKYMEFVQEIHFNVKSRGHRPKIIVLGVEPNGAPPSVVFQQCLKYGVLSDTEENVQRVTKAVRKCHPDLLRRSFNDKLKELCVFNSFEYIDIDEHILNQDGLDDYSMSMVKSEFADIVVNCVHLNWETNLVLYVSKLREKGVCINISVDLHRTREKYIQEKTKNPARMNSYIEES